MTIEYGNNGLIKSMKISKDIHIRRMPMPWITKAVHHGRKCHSQPTEFIYQLHIQYRIEEPIMIMQQES